MASIVGKVEGDSLIIKVPFDTRGYTSRRMQVHATSKGWQPLGVQVGGKPMYINVTVGAFHAQPTAAAATANEQPDVSALMAALAKVMSAEAPRRGRPRK